MKQTCVRLAAVVWLFVPLYCQEKAVERHDSEQEERQEWFYEQRRFPLGHIPTGARLKAIEAIRENERNNPSRGVSSPRALKGQAVTMDPANWAPIGPQPTDQGTSYSTAGRVNAIAIDPRDNKVLYIGAAEGGVWKTIDGGTNWKPLTDGQPSLANGAVVLDPKNPDTVYVGTGEENFTADSYYGAGILKSTDGGASWTNLVGPFLRARIAALAIDPDDSRILLASTDTGVWRSTDGAVTWAHVLGASGSSFAAGTSVHFDPTNGSIVYAALGSIRGNAVNGVYRSTDAGLSWNLVTGTGTAALPVKSVGRIEIAIAPSTPTTLYTAIQDASTAKFGMLLGVWKSTDSGATWNALANFPGSFCGKQCWYDLTLAVDPKNPDMVFGGGVELVRSLDGGSTWAQLPFIGIGGTEIHVDQHFLSFTPDGTQLYVANDGGVYRTTSIATPNISWTELNDTLAITQFYPGVSVHPSDPALTVGGTQDNGTQLYSGSSSWSNIACGDGGWTVLDPTLMGLTYAACQHLEILKATDAVNFFPASYGIDPADRNQFIAPLVQDPGNPGTLYFGTYRLYQSRDGGGRWNAISGDLTTSAVATLKTAAVAPGNSDVVYVGTNLGVIQMTANALAGSNASWTNRSAGLPARAVTQIVVDAVDPMTAYAGFSGFALGTDTQGHVFKTSDGGASWNDISGNLPNLPVNTLVADPDLQGVIYAGTDAGVMATNDGGASWNTLGAGLPMVVVQSLALQRSARVLRAATHGRSAWEIAVPLGSASTEPTITSVTPSQAMAGDPAATVILTGSNFGPGSVVRWNGLDHAATVQDSTHISVVLSAAELKQIGRATLLVFNSAPGAGLSKAVGFDIGPAPVSNSQAFVSAANPTGGNALAPRSIASLYGVNFTSKTALADLAPPLPFTLEGVSLMVGDSIAPLFFVSPGQINFQVPYMTLSGPTPVALVIMQGSFRTTINVTVQPFAPALFTTNAQGSGQAAAVIAGTASEPAAAGRFPESRPAKAGEIISLYGTGLGEVSNRPPLGAPSPSSPLAVTLTKPVVTIGGLPATVSFSGLAPGFVGLYQVNAAIPAGVSAGPAVPVVLTIGGAASNTVTIAIE